MIHLIETSHCAQAAPRGRELGVGRAVEEQSHLKTIWKMVSLGLDDGQVGSAVDGMRDIKDNSQVVCFFFFLPEQQN